MAELKRKTKKSDDRKISFDGQNKTTEYVILGFEKLFLTSTDQTISQEHIG